MHEWPQLTGHGYEEGDEPKLFDEILDLLKPSMGHNQYAHGHKSEAMDESPYV